MRKISLLVVFLLLASFSVLYAQELPVVNLSEIKGLKRIEEGAVKSKLSQKIGEPISQEKTNEDPWGNTFGKNLANTAESGLGGRAKVGQYKVEQSGEKQPAGTTEAGAFPGGKSPYGALDMAGNAWEWTDSWYDKGRMLRVLRGGS